MEKKKTIDAVDLIAAIRAAGVDINYLMKDRDGTIWGTKGKPDCERMQDHWVGKDNHRFGRIAVTEFEGKPWTECVYEREKRDSKRGRVAYVCVFVDTDKED